MRFTFKLWPQETTWEDLRRGWEAADVEGFWSGGWINDHLLPPRASEDLPILEAWTVLAGLAARTRRLTLGTMVACNTYRHPSLLAKMATTVDHVSGGRLRLGLGAGWHEREHEAFGIRLPPLGERFDRLEETLEILRGLFTQDVFDYSGRFYRLRQARLVPKPIQTPGPPLAVGGAGPRRTIPLAARWADLWNFPDFGFDPDTFRERRSLLVDSSRLHGRRVEVSVQFRYSGDLGEVRERIAAYGEIGADEILVSFVPPVDPLEPVRLAERL